MEGKLNGNLWHHFLIERPLWVSKYLNFSYVLLYVLHLETSVRVRCYVWSIVLYGSDTWTLRKLEQKYLESFEMWCWRRMEKRKLSEKVTNEVLECTKEKGTLLNNILRRKVNWICHILRRNYLLHDAIEGQIMEVKGLGRRRKT
jgi:hypothetical protein